MSRVFATSGRSTVLVTAWIVAMLVCPAAAGAVSGRVLVLYWYDKDHPINVAIEKGFQDAVRSDRDVAIEYHAEYMESNRFPEPRQFAVLHNYLKQKYAGKRIDAVVASGTAVYEFVTHDRDTLFPGVPVVFIGTSPIDQHAATRRGITGVVTYGAFRGNVDLLLKLHPDAERIYIVNGTLECDKRYETLARTQLRGHPREQSITYLTDLPVHELIGRVRDLPDGSLVLYAWQQSRNEEGTILDSAHMVSAILPSARVPVYGMSERVVGSGIVGGEVFTLEGNGKRAGELVIRILRGERAIPLVDAPTVPMFDDRQLQRWEIAESLLPPNRVIRFREPPPWERYRPYLFAAAAIGILQTALIGALLLERVWRKRAEASARMQQREVHHLSRIATLGELAGALAHDLAQPLAAIEYSARAGWQRLDENELNRTGLRADLEGILRARELAAGVIRRMRSALQKNGAHPVPLDLNDVVVDVLSLLSTELRSRGVAVSMRLTPSLPAVLGERTELQQVVLNLVLNACEAMSDTPLARRVLIIRTEDADKLIHLAVTDHGSGIPAEVRDKIFEPFVTSKPHGLGLGLAISQTIIAAHRGHIRATANPSGGTTFSFELPVYDATAAPSR